MDRPKRKPQVRIKVFTEGTTEYNYISLFGRDTPSVTIDKPVIFNGGGYSSFLNELKKRRITMGYTAVFVIIDYDKACENSTEANNFLKIVNWCKTNNNSSNVPYFLIVTNPKIEFFACLHSPDYRGQHCDDFILRSLWYRDIEAFKSDPEIYTKLNRDDRSKDVAIEKLKSTNREQIVLYNIYSTKRKGANYIISFTDIIYNRENEHIKCSNFDEFFDICSGHVHK